MLLKSFLINLLMTILSGILKPAVVTLFNVLDY